MKLGEKAKDTDGAYAETLLSNLFKARLNLHMHSENHVTSVLLN